MAQRAYRQRKESTLEELRKRVNELNGIVDSMETIFQDCMQRLVSSNLPETAVNELRITASRLASLKSSSQAKEADLSDDGLVVERTVREPSMLPTPQQPQSGDALAPKNVSIWLDQTELTRPTRRPRVDDYLGLGYSIVLPETAAAAAAAASEEPSLFSFRPQHGKAVSGNSNIDISKQIQLPAQMLKGLDATKTYSFHETTFARRVHRACLEAGYSLLLDPSRNVQTYERVFRLPLLARDRTELIACTKTVLSRGATDSLDLYEAPLIHIGGAGTHYARRDKNGNLQQRKAAYNLGMVGPQTLKLLMQADEQRLTADMAVEIEGFEGEWFDPYDVEGYLMDKGIFVEPAASFVEVEVAASMRALGDRSTMSSRAGTPGQSHPGEGQSTPASLDAYDLNSMPWNPYTDVTIDNPGFPVSGSWMDPTQTSKAAVPANGRNEPKKMIMIDITKLIRGECG